MAPTMKDQLRKQEEKELISWQENKGTSTPASGQSSIKKSSAKNQYHTAPHRNECFHCHRKPGCRFNIDTMQEEKIFLYVDARGFSVCNYCKDAGLLIKKRKLTKKEKKIARQMQNEINAAAQIPHVTLDAKGRKVE